MDTPHTMAVEVLRLIGERLRSKPADLHDLVQSAASSKEWLAAEAFFACKPREIAGDFCEVVARPTYGSENVLDDSGQPDSTRGDLRVGGSYETTDHRWFFAEFVVIHNIDEPQRVIEAAIARLKRLGWKRSISAMILVVASPNDTPAMWNTPALDEPLVLSLPDGGSISIKAFDIKRDPSHVIGTS